MRTDTAQNPGRLHMVPKREYAPFDDCTSTMAAKKAALDAGIRLPREIRYVPSHRRVARGIVAGIIGGTAIWAVLALIAWAAWRYFARMG